MFAPPTGCVSTRRALLIAELPLTRQEVASSAGSFRILASVTIAAQCKKNRHQLDVRNACSSSCTLDLAAGRLLHAAAQAASRMRFVQTPLNSLMAQQRNASTRSFQTTPLLAWGLSKVQHGP